MRHPVEAVLDSVSLGQEAAQLRGEGPEETSGPLAVEAVREVAICRPASSGEVEEEVSAAAAAAAVMTGRKEGGSVFSSSAV